MGTPMSEATGKLSIIIPSFNDPRLVAAVESVFRMDDLGVVQVVIIDGGSRPEIIDAVRPLLRPGDICVSERDKGIFDGLNKGLSLATGDYIGWIGSDDVYTGRVKASDVLCGLAEHDLFIAALAIVRGKRIRRIFHSFISRLKLVRYGLHNPHYGTFGRAALLKSEFFPLGAPGSDIEYFLRIFAHRPRVAITRKIAVWQAEGGFSTKSYSGMLKINWANVAIYRKYNCVLMAYIAVALKVGHKVLSLLWFKIFPAYVPNDGN